MDQLETAETKNKNPQATRALASLSTALVSVAQLLPEGSIIKASVSAFCPFLAYGIMFTYGISSRYIKTRIVCNILKEDIVTLKDELNEKGTTAPRKREIKKEIKVIEKSIQQHRLNVFQIE